MRSSPEQRLRQLLEAAPDAIIEVDEDGHILLLNAMTEKLFGYQREELVGERVEVLLPEALRVAHRLHRRDYHAQPLTRPMGGHLPLRGRRKDGSDFPVEISLSPMRLDEGFGVTAIIRDVSERERSDTQLRKLQDAFTAELQLRNQEAERANKLKSEFLSGVSHELRTPLHTIIGFSELLAEETDGPLNDKQKRFVGHVHRDALHLLELINDVLDLSKIEAGRLELERKDFDLWPVMEQVLSSIEPKAEAKSISLEVPVQAPTSLNADPLRFRQILLNLLSNAIKFTPKGGTVRVGTMQRPIASNSA